MRLEQLPDRRIRAYAQAMRAANLELGQMLERMVDAQPAQRMALYNRIVTRIATLQAQSRQWVNQHLPQFFEEADNKILTVLRRANAPLGDESLGRATLQRLGVEFSERIDQALFSIGANATRLLHASDPVSLLPLHDQHTIRNAGFQAPARSKALRNFRQQLREHPVALLAQNGRIIHYALDYYAGTVASNAYVRTQNLPAEARAATTTDLVRVSSNPSMHGDYCDHYAGKVFSVSGLHPIFPALSATPNGGAPFHPHCAHTVVPVLPTEVLTAEDIVPFSLLLAPGEDASKLPKASRRRR